MTKGKQPFEGIIFDIFVFFPDSRVLKQIQGNEDLPSGYLSKLKEEGKGLMMRILESMDEESADAVLPLAGRAGKQLSFSKVMKKLQKRWEESLEWALQLGRSHALKHAKEQLLGFLLFW